MHSKEALPMDVEFMLSDSIEVCSACGVHVLNEKVTSGDRLSDLNLLSPRLLKKPHLL